MPQLRRDVRTRGGVLLAVRDLAGPGLMRKLLGGQPIRLSLVIVTIASVAATAVILTGAGVRTPAQRAALVALREPVPTRTVVVAAARPPAATPTATHSAVPTS